MVGKGGVTRTSRIIHDARTRFPPIQLTSKQDYEVLGYYTWLYEGSQTMR